MTRTVGLFGCGTIGNKLAGAFADGTVHAELSVAYDRNPPRREQVADLFDDPPVLAEAPAELLEADLVVEAADQSAVGEIAVRTLESGTDLMLLSVGALADKNLRSDVMAAVETGGDLYFPSGAIAGLDAVKAAALTGDLEVVSLTTTKNPAGLEGAPYLEEKDVDLSDLDEATTVFSGPASKAAAAFPSNINVAMALSLAGIGPESTEVRIVADPLEENNVHHIEATGGMGEIETTVRNVPSPRNPKTSYLAALSAFEQLRGLPADVSVGT
jgi:aspartate dehydrogenase